VIVKPALNVALVDVGEEHRQVFKEVCVAAGYSPVFKTTCNVCTDGLGRWADVVFIECDLGFRALHSAEKARRCGTCPIGVLVNWWSDLERDASEAADFVLHVPLTPDEIRHVLVCAVPMRSEGAQRSGTICQDRPGPAQRNGLTQGPCSRAGRGERPGRRGQRETGQGRRRDWPPAERTGGESSERDRRSQWPVVRRCPRRQAMEAPALRENGKWPSRSTLTQ